MIKNQSHDEKKTKAPANEQVEKPIKKKNYV